MMMTSTCLQNNRHTRLHQILCMSNADVLFQTEISSKLDFIWRRKFGVEKEEVETMASVNKVLLENILPAHVAEHFLSSQHRQEVCSIISTVLLHA